MVFRAVGRRRVELSMRSVTSQEAFWLSGLVILFQGG